MVEQWLLESGTHQPPAVPEGSDIAATLAEVKRDPVSKPDIATISAALTSGNEGAMYGGLDCLQRLQQHHPTLLDELEGEFLQAFQESENPFVMGRVAELVEQQAEIEGETDDLVSEFGELLDPQFSVRIRGPVLRMVARGIEDNWMQFGSIEPYIRGSLTSSYPSLQAPALEILATVVERSSTYDAVDYADEALTAVHVDDSAVEEQALRVLSSIAFAQPGVAGQVFDRVAELADADSPAVRRWALQCAYGVGLENQDLLAPVVPAYVSVLVGDDDAVRERLSSAFPNSPVTQFAARPVINSIFWDDAVLDRIETEQIVEWFDASLVGTREGIEPMILLAELADREPEAVSPVGSLLEPALTTGYAGRQRPLEDTAFLLGRLAEAAPELVDSVIESHLDALDDPHVDDELVAWELGHVAHGAPDHVADALGVAGVSEWPDDPFDDSVGSRLCRGMLATVTPGYTAGGERSAALAETALRTYLDEETEGYFGEVLHRLARTEPSLVEPHASEVAKLLDGNFIRMQLLGAQILGTIDASDQLRRHQADSRLLADRIEDALGQSA